LIRQALEKTRGNRSQAARLLEISHPSLLSKIKAYHIGE
jgi:two-component system response regulator AtoC